MGDAGEEGASPPRKRARSELGVVAKVPEKSPNDKKQYRHLICPSGFEALLVSSNDVKKSDAAAAVVVPVGSFSDPQGRCEGLAHYLEHMLFMGSEKYPGEEEMEDFLSKHGGYSNAYTESSHTCYYLEVNKASLHKALDMLAQFFIAPLLKTEAAEREINAIDSEFRLTQNSDSSRSAQLFASFAKDGHPYRLFGWGNLSSLIDAPKKVGVDINEELRGFYQKHYHAGAIRLCVFGIESLDTLEEAVLTSFGSLATRPPDTGPSLQDAALAAAGAPFKEESLPKLLRVRPVKDVHRLTLAWQLPPTRHLYKTRPVHYIQHLVGHEGAGSLLSGLQRKGLATQLSAGIAEDDFETNSMCSIFSVQVTLTALGMESWPDVVHLAFLYFDMLRREGPQRWLHDELVAIQEMGWRFLQDTSPSEYVQQLACSMRPDLGIEHTHVMKASWMSPEWEPATISELLASMTPSRCMINVLSSCYGQAKNISSASDNENEETEAQTDRKNGAGEKKKDDLDEEKDQAEEEEEEEDEEDEEEGDGEEGRIDQEDRDAQTNQNNPARDPTFDALASGPPSIEQHFGTEFWEATKTELSDLMNKWTADPVPGSLTAEVSGLLRFPDRNRFIATEFGLRPPPSDKSNSATLPPPADATDVTASLRRTYASFPPLPSPLPQVPKDLPGSVGAKIWHLQDLVFETPRSELWLKFSSNEPPMKPESASAHVLMEWLMRVLSDTLNETVYLAEQASLYLRVGSQNYGFDITAGGFHHKLPLLLEAGLHEAMSLGASATWESRQEDAAFLARMGAQREQLLRYYTNAWMRPGDHAADLRRMLLQPHMQAAPERSKALDALSARDLSQYAIALIPKMRAEIMFIGNATSEDAEHMAASLVKQVGSELFSQEQKHPHLRVAVVPKAVPTIWVAESPDSANRNVAVECYWQFGYQFREPRASAVLDLLEAIMAEPLFDSLRTKQQLGYVASCGARCTCRVLGLSVWLLSSREPPAEICRRIEKFIPEFRERVATMPDEDFERHVSSLAAQKLEPDRTLLNVQEHAWSELEDQEYVFDRRIQEAMALASVGRSDVLRLLDHYIMQGAPERRMIVVAVVGGRAKTSKSAEVESFSKDYPGCRLVESQADFLANVEFYDWSQNRAGSGQ